MNTVDFAFSSCVCVDLGGTLIACGRERCIEDRVRWNHCETIGTRP
jgi:hypothetical protein